MTTDYKQNWIHYLHFHVVHTHTHTTHVHSLNAEQCSCMYMYMYMYKYMCIMMVRSSFHAGWTVLHKQELKSNRCGQYLVRVDYPHWHTE